MCQNQIQNSSKIQLHILELRYGMIYLKVLNKVQPCHNSNQNILSGFIHKTEHKMYYRILLPVVIYVCESKLHVHECFCSCACEFVLCLTIKLYNFMYSVYIINLYALFKKGPQGRLEKIQNPTGLSL